jgi:hypothetical protein
MFRQMLVPHQGGHHGSDVPVYDPGRDEFRWDEGPDARDNDQRKRQGTKQSPADDKALNYLHDNPLQMGRRVARSDSSCRSIPTFDIRQYQQIGQELT